MSSEEAVNPLDHIAIQNVLSRYCEALDTKIFDLLAKVFVPDVTASYPFNPNLNSLDDIRNAVQNRLGPIPTHHSLTTQIITFPPPLQNPTSSSSSSIYALRKAHATTHFIGAHLGIGPHAGEVLTAYGRYIDELVCLPIPEGGEGNAEGVTGASGIWRISKRTVVFTGRVGDERIMTEY